MFIQFQTVKGENVIVSTEKIQLIQQERKGVTIVMDDGTPITISQEIERVYKRLEDRGLTYPKSIALERQNRLEN